MTNRTGHAPVPTRRSRPIRLATALLAAAVVAIACAEQPDDLPVERPPVVDVEPEPEPEPDDDAVTDDDPDELATDDEAEPRAPDPDLTVALTLTEVATLDSPTAGAVGPDGVLHLADRAGTVHPLTEDGAGEAVVDLSAETTTESERGLLGLAFAADGTELYLSSTDPNGASTITAVAIVDGRIRPDDRRTLFRLSQPYANHNGGDLHIGPDDLLYLGLGDGGSAGDPLDAGQDLSTPLGALLRIDPRGGDPYAVPSSNPFVDEDDAAPEIFAYGLRNPWRFSFDPVTDELWIADVGQDSREEINRVAFEEAAGANFGWNRMEGTLPFEGEEPDDHVPPVYEYETRGPQGCAVTGGVVYRGRAIPELTGVYLYADYCNGTVRGLIVDADGEVVEQGELGIDGGQVVAFATDADGEVYVLDLGGAVQRIDAA
ncbi:MAG: sugar dehydrogenase [Nitriliruptor sp.]|nr:MAG: sugar dehydrogenase [Nitriliruptor sp.]